LGRGFGHGKEGKRRWHRLEEEGTPDTWGHVVSDSKGKKARPRASWASSSSLGSAQARTRGRKGTGRARGKEGRAVGYRLCWARQNPRREMKILFFFFSQNFKAFSNGILKFYLSFQIEHSIQNIMQ
jgi:hypothetical protein